LGPVYFDLVGSYGKSDLDLLRNVSFSNFSNASAAAADARYYSLSATAGFSSDFGSFEVEPYAGVRYADVRIDAFSEGAGLTNLSVGRQSAESLQGVVGLRLGADYPMGSARIRPSVRAEYRREFENDEARLISTSFNGAGINSPFTTTTTPMGDDQLAVGAGLTIAGDSPISMVADYTGQFLGGYEIHGIQVGLRMRF
jgi:outer membrane autotransporter protein